MSDKKEALDFVDYLINEIDKNELATLYYQAIHTLTVLAEEDLDEPVHFYEIHNSNVELLAEIIETTDKEVRH